jgi:hypothetical protein
VEPPKGGNIRKTSEVLDLIKSGHDLIPFAIVTPEGEWCQKGKMGWWAMVSDENSNWKTEARAILEKYPETYAITVDCHV